MKTTEERRSTHVITVKDEELHPPDPGQHWQESFYFNWSTPDHREFGLTRLGINPSAGTADAVVLTFAGGKLEVVYAETNVPINHARMLERSVSGGLTVGSLTYTMLDPLGSWHLGLTGANIVDLTWTAFTPAVDFHQAFGGDVERTQEHFEQSGRVTGTVELNGRRREVTGLGQRDKSWGVRDWNGLTGWDWIAGQFDDNLSFNATRTDIAGTQMPTGFVWVDGTAHPVVDVQVDYQWTKKHQPDSAAIRVTVDSGAEFSIRARTIARAPLVKNGLFIEESQVAFETEIDGRTRRGVGIVEHAYHVGQAGTLLRLPRLLPVLRKAKAGSR